MRLRENEICEAVTETLAGLDLIANDDVLRRMLGASVAANLSLIMELATGVVTIEQVVVPPPAAAYAERLAQRGVSADRLVRAYFVAQNQVKHYLYDEVEQLDVPRVAKLRVVHDMSDLFFQYIDKVTVAILEIHQAEERRWNQATGNMASVMVHRVLAGEDPPAGFAEETGIHLDQQHVGLVLWSDDAESSLRELERASRELASRQGGGRVVFSALDPTTAWVWVPRGNRSEPLAADTVRRALAAVPSGRASVGLPAFGVAGFRRTHRQALAAREIALAGSDQVTGYGDEGVAAVSMLARDDGELRLWVAEALGGLAVDNETNERLRETVLIFLQAGGSINAAAETLVLHRNSLRYRLSRAAEVRGRNLDESRMDLELALHCVRLLGKRLLTPDSRNDR